MSLFRSSIPGLRLLVGKSNPYSTAAPVVVDRESMLYSQTVTFKGGKHNVDISLPAVYQDSDPSNSSRATVVALHGAPGSHHDFKYLLPLLAKKQIRLVSLNYPGHGYTQYDSRLTWENEERNRFVQEVIKQLQLVGAKPLVFLGHSRGGENALQLAANNKMCMLYAYSGKDFLIETEISREMANTFDGAKHMICSTVSDPLDDTRVTREAVDALLAGSRLLAVEFEKEGHFLQKFRANFTAEVIDAMLNRPKKP